jgi:DNA-binding LacI/PurR family transcriptional regulator
MPVVFQGSTPIEGALFVTVDNYSGGCSATQHLIDQGYQHVGHISGPLEFWDAKARKAGWCDTLKKNGVLPTDSQWAEGDWSVESGARAVSSMLRIYPNMDAIFVANDQMAIGAIRKLKEHGLRVPDDLGIVGYDNIPESAYNSPPLTTISQDFHQMGEKTMEVLESAIRAQQSGNTLDGIEPIILNSELIIRQSSLSLS